MASSRFGHDDGPKQHPVDFKCNPPRRLFARKRQKLGDQSGDHHSGSLYHATIARTSNGSGRRRRYPSVQSRFGRAGFLLKRSVSGTRTQSGDADAASTQLASEALRERQHEGLGCVIHRLLRPAGSPRARRSDHEAHARSDRVVRPSARRAREPLSLMRDQGPAAGRRRSLFLRGYADPPRRSVFERNGFHACPYTTRTSLSVFRINCSSHPAGSHGGASGRIATLSASWARPFS